MPVVPIVIAASVALVVGAVTVAPRIFVIPTVVAIGVYSYSIYLWHVPMLDLSGGIHSVSPGMKAVLGIVATIAASLGSYYVVERPFLRFKNRIGPRRELDRPTSRRLTSAGHAVAVHANTAHRGQPIFHSTERVSMLSVRWPSGWSRWDRVAFAGTLLPLGRLVRLSSPGCARNRMYEKIAEVTSDVLRRGPVTALAEEAVVPSVHRSWQARLPSIRSCAGLIVPPIRYVPVASYRSLRSWDGRVWV